MRFSSILNCSFLCALLPLAVSAIPFEFNAAPANNLKNRAFDNARITFYNPAGLVTACGRTVSGSDLIVALSSEQFGSGSACGRTVAITANGRRVTAQVEDLCPFCTTPDIDVSRSVFVQLADINQGLVIGSWDFV